MASLGIQVHGGMGFVEETGAAQLLRDIRIAPIYEGTNAIQAIDLVMRKIPREGGTEVARLIAESRADVARAENRVGPSAAILAEALTALEAATAHLLSPTTGEAAKLLVAQTYLRLFGLALGGALLSRGAAAAGTREADWIRLARIYAEDIAAEAEGLAGQVLSTRRDPADYRALAGVG